jgi:predicted aspartyl protease
MKRMETFRIAMTIESLTLRGRMKAIDRALVDTGSEFTWAPRTMLEELGIEAEFPVQFVMADGRELTREMGMAIVHVGRFKAPDYVVFGEPKDLVILGAHTLEGMNLRVDTLRKRLVSGGPIVVGLVA